MKAIPITSLPTYCFRNEASTCDDLDEECEDIEDKTRCWVYAPERGMCPWLRAKESDDGS